MGVICGVTTNPSLIAKEGKNFIDVVKEITTIVDGPISAEVISLDTEGMVKEAEELVKTINNKNLVIKIPMTPAGLGAVKQLTAKGIKTNVTLIFSAAQALLAARAGATYVSPFVGRLDDICEDGIALVGKIVEMYRYYGYTTQVLAASIRHTAHIMQCIEVGADVATCPLSAIKGLLNHPLTDSGLKKFLEDYKRVNG